MEIHELETRIEMATERLHELAEQLNELEFQGYTDEDTEWMDIALEAQMLLGYRSELRAILQERLNSFSNPSSSNAANEEENVVSFSNAANEELNQQSFSNALGSF